MKMENDQDPDSYLNDMAELRDELEALGTTYNDNQIPADILDGLLETYSGIKYEADTRNGFDLERAKYTMRNMYSIRGDRSSQPSKDRSSAMVAATAVKSFSFCNRKGHDVSECFKQEK